jgi:hypothetical protein
VKKAKGRGGARKGAGRPRFAKGRAKTSYFSTRITEKTRDLLEEEARRHGGSLAEIAEHLLLVGMGQKAERRKKNPLRALCFLLENLSGYVSGPTSLTDDPAYSWHSNPYMFEAFRTAVIDLLNQIRPTGEVVTPPREGSSRALHPSEKFRQQESVTPIWDFPEKPEDYGHTIARDLLITMQRKLCETTEEHYNWLPTAFHKDVKRWHYGLIDAWRDLDLKKRGSEEDFK